MMVALMREAGRPGSDAPDRGFRRVLVVEDEPVLRNIIARNLRSRGCAVREAATAHEAVAALRADLPDLMLLDINLPDRTGWDVLRDLAANGQEVPTVVLSAVRVSPARLAEFRPLAYLPKPFPIEALLRLVGDSEGDGTGAGADDLD
jgi:DNA-binding response OmpR family regulator